MNCEILRRSFLSIVIGLLLSASSATMRAGEQSAETNSAQSSLSGEEVENVLQQLKEKAAFKGTGFTRQGLVTTKNLVTFALTFGKSQDDWKLTYSKTIKLDATEEIGDSIQKGSTTVTSQWSFKLRDISPDMESDSIQDDNLHRTFHILRLKCVGDVDKIRQDQKTTSNFPGGPEDSENSKVSEVEVWFTDVDTRDEIQETLSKTIKGL